MTREIKGHDIFYYLEKLAKELRDHPDTQIQIYAGTTIEQIIKEFQAVPETKTKAVFDFPENLMISYFVDWEGWECILCGEQAGDHRDMYRHLATHTKEELENLTTSDGDNAENDEGTVMPAIHSRFITPPKKSSPINAQQQPKQKAPCTAPMRNAPQKPGRQC